MMESIKFNKKKGLSVGKENEDRLLSLRGRAKADRSHAG